MISAKTNYGIHEYEFLAIIKTFKTWEHYIKNFNYKLLILTNHNNIYYFLDIRSLT